MASLVCIRPLTLSATFAIIEQLSFKELFFLSSCDESLIKHNESSFKHHSAPPQIISETEKGLVQTDRMDDVVHEDESDLSCGATFRTIFTLTSPSLLNVSYRTGCTFQSACHVLPVLTLTPPAPLLHAITITITIAIAIA